MSKENSQTSSNTEPIRQSSSPNTLGDPNCPHCGGAGYLRLDVPVEHPQFGRLQVCICRQKDIANLAKERLYAISDLEELKHLTFETFQSRGQIGIGPSQAASIERAYNQAHQFAQSLDGWLLLQGKYGCGKTHLAAAIANFAVSLGIHSLFITVPDLLDSLRFSYSDPESTFEQRFEEIRQVPLLVLDDFGTQNATNWAQEKLFQIINYRYINKLPLVITTNLAIEEIEARIRSRLQDPELVTRVRIIAPDYRRPADDTGHHELSSLHLLRNRTFGRFNLRKNEKLTSDDQKSLEKAFRAAQAYAEKPEGWIVFMGTYGCGKTHLAAAIANYRAGLGFPPLFVMVPDLLDHLRATFAPESQVRYDRRFIEVKKTPLLILDDLGTQSMTPWVREKLYQLFNYRYNAELPTVITMADTIEELHRTDPRLATRMLDRQLCSPYAITAPPYRGNSPSRSKKRRNT